MRIIGNVIGILICFITITTTAQINNHFIGSEFAGSLASSTNPVINDQVIQTDFNVFNLSFSGDHFIRGFDSLNKLSHESVRFDANAVLASIAVVSKIKNIPIGIAFTTKNNISSRLLTTNTGLVNNLYLPDLTLPVVSGDANYFSHQYSEMGLTFSSEVYAQKRNRVSVGVTGKWVTGEVLKMGNVSGLAVDNSGSYASASSYSFQSKYINQLTDRPAMNLDGNNIPFFPGTASGSPSTLSMDFGVKYNFKRKRDDLLYEMNDSQYLATDVSHNIFSVGVAINNAFGSLQYSDNVAAADRDTSRLLQYAQNLTPNSTVDISLPTQIIAFFDIHATKELAFNFNFQRIQFSYFDGTNYQQVAEQTFGFVPKYEYKAFGLYFPVQVPLEADRNAEVGVAIAWGPVRLRLDNFLPYGVNTDSRSGVQFGLSVPIRSKKLKDDDKDLVSNKYDLCKDERGTWLTQGCPDIDEDSIPDFQDSCAREFGLREFNGCPDTDGDGIINGKDECPFEFGVIYFKGCPDSDADSIRDELDMCPNAFGLKTNQGCPDTDGDGVHDGIDQCPKIFGSVESKGCLDRDTDNDGIIDSEDNCPNQAGRPENKGCPTLDKTIFEAELQKLVSNFRWEFKESALERASYDIIDEVVLFLDEHPELGVNIVILPKDSDSASTDLAQERKAFLLNLIESEYEVDPLRMLIKVSKDQFFENTYTRFTVFEP